MKNTKLTLLSTAAAVLLSSNAMAQEPGKFYGSIHGEVVAHSKSDYDLTVSGVTASGDIDYDVGFGIGGAVGYNLTEEIRVEGELAYRETDIDSSNGGAIITGSTNIAALMANTYYNFPLDDKFSPYLGAGLGAAYDDGSGEFAFAYQGMAGVDYKVDDKGTVYGGYRYFATNEFEDTGFNLDVTQHIVEVGYRYTF